MYAILLVVTNQACKNESQVFLKLFVVDIFVFHSCFDSHNNRHLASGGCKVQFAQFVAVLVVVATQVVVMIPLHVHPLLIILVRVS